MPDETPDQEVTVEELMGELESAFIIGLYKALTGQEGAPQAQILQVARQYLKDLPDDPNAVQDEVEEILSKMKESKNAEASE